MNTVPWWAAPWGALFIVVSSELTYAYFSGKAEPNTTFYVTSPQTSILWQFILMWKDRMRGVLDDAVATNVTTREIEDGSVEAVIVTTIPEIAGPIVVRTVAIIRASGEVETETSTTLPFDQASASA